MPYPRLHVSIPWSAFSSHPRVYPFFLPFRGCARRCLFCAQDIVTGQTTGLIPLKHLLEQLMASLKLAPSFPPMELAFYGGTFTNLDPDEFALCLEFVQEAWDKHLILAARCSTRPDYLDERRLLAMRQAHFTTIELGIQSFNPNSLAICKRFYTLEQIHLACQMVGSMGFKLGIQLMPGMPGNTPELFLDDVRQAIFNCADFLRFYPCLVLAQTGLASLWEQGQFKPWDLDLTIETLALGLNLAIRAKIPVIRMGLPPEMDFSQVLAGPWCADLGARVQAQALFLSIAPIVCVHLAQYPKLKLILPQSMQGFFWGHGGNLRLAYGKIGLTKSNVCFESISTPTLVFEE